MRRKRNKKKGTFPASSRKRKTTDLPHTQTKNFENSTTYPVCFSSKQRPGSGGFIDKRTRCARPLMSLEWMVFLERSK